VSEEFKDLFNRMFVDDPHRRLSLSQIAEHPWVVYQDLPCAEEVDQEIIRLNKIRQG
jgi:hypothetical protein